MSQAKFGSGDQIRVMRSLFMRLCVNDLWGEWRLIPAAIVIAALLVVSSRPSTAETQASLPQQSSSGSVLSGRLTPELFISGKFVAYTDLWGIWVPEGDPIVFRPDGTVENERAGLRGNWEVVDEATLLVAGRKFRYTKKKGCFFSPLEPGADVGWYIVLEKDRQEWLKCLTRPR